MPPNIVDDESSASTVAVREGLNASLTCKAKGNPEPKILWRRENGLNITIDRRKKGKQTTRLLWLTVVILLNKRKILMHPTKQYYNVC